MKLILALATITLLTACGGGGGDTEPTTDTPQTPSALTATVQGAYQIDLSWSAVSGASYYRLYNGSTEIYTNNGTIYNHTGLTANTSYSYTLKACTDSNSNTCSSASSAISATTQEDTQTTPQTPSAPSASVQSANQINLSWSSVSGASYYRLYSSDSEIYATSSISYNHTGLTANTSYSYTLEACTGSDSNTCSSASSAISATTQDDTQTTPQTPQTPSAPIATVQGAYQIDLSWSAVSGASYYRLSRGDGEIYTGNNTSYANIRLTANTAYSYTLKACTDSNSNTCSSASSAISATTAQTPSPTLNDTGIILGGNATGNNSTCSSSITAPQDCHYGRDASLTLSVSTFTYAIDGSKIAKIGAGATGFDFTKLSSTGATLPATASSWSCVKDNITGLVWEVKTTTSGIHYEDTIYTWGGLTAVGRDHADRQGSYFDGWNILVNGSNTEELCGFNDWRVSTINELRGIAHQGKIANPAIDTNYFPNTNFNYGFWSANPMPVLRTNAWIIHPDGSTSYHSRANSLKVRLVRVGE